MGPLTEGGDRRSGDGREPGVRPRRKGQQACPQHTAPPPRHGANLKDEAGVKSSSGGVSFDTALGGNARRMSRRGDSRLAKQAGEVAVEAGERQPCIEYIVSRDRRPQLIDPLVSNVVG